MSNAGAIRAGRGFVELFTDNSAFTRGLKQAQSELTAWGQGIAKIGAGFTALGTGIVAPLVAAAKQFADVGSRLDDMAQRTGISASALSELDYAATMSGTTLEAVEGGVRKMQKALAEATSGNKTAADTFRELGLSVASLAKMSPDQQFEATASAIARITDPAQRAAAAMSVFGKGGAELLPLLAGGANGIRDLRTEAQRLGLTMSDESAADAAAFGDAIDKLKASFAAIVNTIGAAVAPILTELAGTASEVLATVGKWIKQNKELVVTALKVGAAITGIGAVLLTAGGALAGLGALAGIAASAIGVVGTIIAAIASPVGIAVAALAGLAAAFVTYTTVGREWLDYLLGGVTTLKDDAIAAFGAIGTALAKGDIAAAGAVMWASLQLVWARGKASLMQVWATLTTEIQTTFADAWFGVQMIYNDVVSGIQLTWIEATTAMAGAWTTFTTGIRSAWNSTQGFLAKQITRLMGYFDKSIDVEAVVKEIDNQTAGENKALNQQADAQRAEQMQVRDQRASAVEAARAKAEADLVAANIATNDAIRSANQQAVDDALADLETKKQAFAEATAAVQTEITKGTKTQGPGTGGTGTEPQAPPTAERSSVIGSFSAFSIRGFGADTVQQRIAKATEETAKNTKQTEDPDTMQ